MSGQAIRTANIGGMCGDNDGNIRHCYWGGQSLSMDGVKYEGEYGTTTETMRFGDGAAETGWPMATLPGWGDVPPTNWDVATLGAWTNPWSSLGGWNGGNSIYPSFK